MSAPERLVAIGYRSAWRLVRLLPERAAYAAFQLVADVLWRRRGGGVQRLEGNLRRARPGLDEAGLRALSRDGMRSYFRYWCDSFRLPDWTAERLAATVRAEGDGPVRAALASGRGVVMFLGHLGNWDHAGAWSTGHLAPVTTVAERLKPEEVYDAFVAFRERLGMEILPLTGRNDVYPTLLARLRSGGFVPLLADRDLTARGVEVDLLGERARVAAGPASLAVDSGAALFPVTIRYERRTGPGPRWGIVVHWYDEVPVGPGGADRRTSVQAATQACADALGEGIRTSPQDWHMLQTVFVADLDPRRARAAASS